MIRTTF